MKVAIVYDRVNKWGGAERVLLALNEIFPDADLYTSVYNPKTAPWAKRFKVRTSFLQKVPGASSSHEYFALLMPAAFEQFTFDTYDLIISVTSEAAKGILTKPQTKHICICLTPTRYLWSGYDAYFASPLLRLLATPAVTYLRKWDKVAAARPDVFIAISQEVAKRIQRYYQREAEVIYPGILPLVASDKDPIAPQVAPQDGYFLVVSRLVPYKRIDLAIKACTALSLPLIVIGTGSEERTLHKLAGPSVSFVGHVSDGELAWYYEHCRALVFPGEEDFGLTILEAQVHGKPVIAYDKGGARETIIPEKTGLFFTEQTESSLTTALQTFFDFSFSATDCRNQAKRFNVETFELAILSLVTRVVEKNVTW